MAELNETRLYDTGISHGPAVLPAVPAMWSYSSLKEAETCPRRFALARADYPDLWKQRGYPRLPNLPAIKGDVVHGALQIIVTALVTAGCVSPRTADAVTVLRDLGGYTAVAQRTLDEQLRRLDGNPRMSADRREQVDRALSDWLPEAREQIQSYLNRMTLHPHPTPAPAGAPTRLPVKRYPIRGGTHPERELVAAHLRVKGRVDVLSVDADGAEITDTKTGAEAPTHRDQLRLYALLWTDDRESNPDALPVTALVVAYPHRDVVVAVPTEAELAELRAEVTARVGRADAMVAADRPAAVVGEQCGACDVRGLCDAYWEGGASNTVDVVDGGWYDVEGTVLREHGVKSWVLRERRTGSDLLVRTPRPSFTLPVGEQVRILGVKRTIDPDEADALIASANSSSEILSVVSR
ncbi:PD-(D/E)XK nuclease family protein [Microbacterium sp. MRS-1]|uniref:PD-(D/E)XK nuclease family protein n=1 Tax=Microbacterium sp. MRS-1 TaxID=1451261 RepID=UPI000445145C|nr:PD-(D/E)XK nuclease family protein [Microbacterium sp. MRS-1]EXJ52039.1 hypothetical protein AS96_06450 [Microbacterium sp. MRS-1]